MGLTRETEYVDARGSQACFARHSHCALVPAVRGALILRIQCLYAASLHLTARILKHEHPNGNPFHLRAEYDDHRRESHEIEMLFENKVPHGHACDTAEKNDRDGEKCYEVVKDRAIVPNSLQTVDPNRNDWCQKFKVQKPYHHPEHAFCLAYRGEEDGQCQAKQNNIQTSRRAILVRKTRHQRRERECEATESGDNPQTKIGNHKRGNHTICGL